MEKVMYVLWGGPGEDSGDALRTQLLDEVAPRLLAGGAHGVTVDVHDAAAAEAPSPAPGPDGEPPHVAVVSVWVDCYERTSAIEDALAATGCTVAGYLVVESLYDDYGTTEYSGPRTWPDGERSPGVLTVALIHRPEGLEYDEWIERWHGTQSPESARLQPRTRYVRNEVVRAITAGAPEIHGIVEEAWPSAGHIIDPLLFFNATTPEQLNDHVAQMIANVQACLDLARLRSSTMSEYLVRSLV